MNVHSRDRDLGRIRREGLVFDLGRGGTIERVGRDGPKLRRFQVQDAPTDLFVAGEHDLHRAVRDGRVLDQNPGRFHDHREARFIVRTQQRRAVGRDHRLADHGV